MHFLLTVKTAEKDKVGFDSLFEYLYLRIYEFFYITGIRFLRQVRGGYHFAVNELKYLKAYISKYLFHIKKHFETSLKNFLTGKYHALLSYRKKRMLHLKYFRTGKNTALRKILRH